VATQQVRIEGMATRTFFVRKETLLGREDG
jgi:hypothetical protein